MPEPERPDPKPKLDEPLLRACAVFVRRCGARQLQIRYSDDEEPLVWFCVALFDEGRVEAAAAVGAGALERAALRLCERLADGGHCQHCDRPTGLTADFEGAMPLSDVICWYRFDPELATFRRGCE